MSSVAGNLFRSAAVNLSAVNDKPSALILDDKGRAVDSSGKALSMMSRMPTLKANIRAKKREAFMQVEKPTDDMANKSFFDNRVRLVDSDCVLITNLKCSYETFNTRTVHLTSDLWVLPVFFKIALFW